MSKQIKYAQNAPEQFDWPEFFDNGLVAYATDSVDNVEVYRCGEADIRYMGRDFRAAEQFRDGFPDGVIPSEDEGVEWTFNGWFEVVEVDDGVDPLSNEIYFSLTEATDRAMEILTIRQEGSSDSPSTR